MQPAHDYFPSTRVYTVPGFVPWVSVKLGDLVAVDLERDVIGAPIALNAWSPVATNVSRCAGGAAAGPSVIRAPAGSDRQLVAGWDLVGAGELREQSRDRS